MALLGTSRNTWLDDMQVWISDCDKKVLGRVRTFEEHCDTVLKQVKEIWIESPMIGNDKEHGRLIHKERPTYKMLKRVDLVILVTKTDKRTWTKCKDWLDQCTSIIGPEQEAAPNTNSGSIKKTSGNSPTSGMSIDGKRRETPTENTVSRTMKRTSHEASEAMKDNMNIQTRGTYLQSSGTKEKYMTQETDHTFVWKNMWREVELSRDDPETINAPTDTHTEGNDSEVGSISTGIVALSVS